MRDIMTDFKDFVYTREGHRSCHVASSLDGLGEPQNTKFRVWMQKGPVHVALIPLRSWTVVWASWKRVTLGGPTRRTFLSRPEAWCDGTSKPPPPELLENEARVWMCGVQAWTTTLNDVNDSENHLAKINESPQCPGGCVGTYSPVQKSRERIDGGSSSSSGAIGRQAITLSAYKPLCLG
jgi:hypothetical protein